MELLKRMKDKGADRRDRYLLTLVAIIVVGYAFFLSSKLWMPPDEASVPATEIGHQVEANERRVSIVSWVYDEEQREMEVMIDITNMSVDGINRYRWSAMEINSGRLQVEVIMEDNDFVVLHILKIPRRFEEISLRMGINSEDEVKREELFNDIRLYATKDSVSRTEIKSDMTETEYRIAACDAKIDNFNIQIEETQALIENERHTISEAENTINNLETAKVHQTSTEIEETNSAITEVRNKKEMSETAIVQYEKEIEDLKEKIAIQEEVRDSYEQ